jgi:hypothetical protein
MLYGVPIAKKGEGKLFQGNTPTHCAAFVTVPAVNKITVNEAHCISIHPTPTSQVFLINHILLW